MANRKLPFTEFIRRSKEKHGDKYDYSKVSYNSIHDKVMIICPIHGEFEQTAKRHMEGFGCKKCSNKEKKTNEEIEKRLKEFYGNKYDYSKLNYESRYKKITLICPKHGEFEMWPHQPFPSNPCPKCGSKRFTNEEYIERASKKHNNFYLYDKTEYVNSREKVIITCPKHGDFEQIPYAHLRGQGCPICNQSKLENMVKEMLDSNNIEYIRQAKFEWLNRLTYDFYLPKQNIAIECQGEQHFKPIEHFGGKEKFKTIQFRDETKYNLSKENNIKLLYFADKKFNENIITSIEELKEKILI